MDEIEIHNIVAGRDRPTTHRVSFEGWTLPESDLRDVGAALKAMAAQPRIAIDDAVAALADIGRAADWISDHDLALISRRTGSAVKYLRRSISRLNGWLANLPESLDAHGSTSRHGYRTGDGIWTGDLRTALVLAGDATAVGPLALAHSVLAGARTVVKGSRYEPLAPYLFLRALQARGLPVPQLLFFDSSSDVGRGLLTRMLESTAQSVVYGADETIAAIYGRATMSAAHKKIGFWAGRSGVLVLPDADAAAAGRAIAIGTAEDRGNRCVSTMKAFVPETLSDTVVKSLLHTMHGFQRGEPDDPLVDLGRLPARSRQEALDSVGGGEVIYDQDAIFLSCRGPHYLLREELPYPICAIRIYADDEDPVALLNETTAGSAAGRGLELAVFTSSAEALFDVAERTTACKVMHNVATTDLNHDTTHQGIYLFKELMRFCAVM